MIPRGVLVLMSVIAATGAVASLPGPSWADRSQRAEATSTVWRPDPGTTWQWQIVGRVKPPFEPVDMYDIDLQDAMPRRTVSHFRLDGHRRTVTWAAGENAGVIAQLHRANKIVICYLDSGAAERYRPDWRLFPRSVRLNNTGWPNEYWLDIRHRNWSRFAPIIWARFALAARIGCDGVEPDENNPVGNVPRSTGITLADEKSWYLKVAAQAHQDGLSVGMKNGIDTSVTDTDTVHAFDWDLNEECFYYQECGALQQFIHAGKAVFQTEYAADWRHRDTRFSHLRALRTTVCGIARRHSFSQRFSILVKRKVPDKAFVSC